MEPDSSAAIETLYSVDCIELLLDDVSQGNGKLILYSKSVHWRSESNTEHNFIYQNIVMHAVSKHEDKSSIYAQISLNSEDDLMEVRFIPENATLIPELFDAFSRGALMNPDETTEEGAGDFFFDDETMMNGDIDILEEENEEQEEQNGD